MIFGGILADDLGFEPFGYVTSMIATIALWIVIAPLAGTIARGQRTPTGFGMWGRRR